MRSPETITRRNLPHWYMPGAAHFVTYRRTDRFHSVRFENWRIESKLY